MRLTALLRLIIAAAGLLTTTPAATAQTALRPIDRSLSWCTTPSPNPEWGRQPILLQLEENRDELPTGADTTRLPLPHLVEILTSAREYFRKATGLAGTSTDSGSVLAAGEARYTVGALWGEMAFQLRGDGTLGSVIFRDVRDSTFFNDIAAALRAVQAAGEFLPFGPVTLHKNLTLKPALSRSNSSVAWAMFAMEVPSERYVKLKSGGPPSFPPGLLGWNADIRLNFYVDASGRPEARTIVATPLPDSLASRYSDARAAYANFVAISKRAVERSRFTPAEFLGCRYRREVMQPVQFQTRN